MRSSIYQNLGLGMASGAVIASVIVVFSQTPIPLVTWMYFALGLTLMLAGAILKDRRD